VTTYSVTFERIGRNHRVGSREFTVADQGASNHLAYEIHQFASQHLISSDFTVTVDLEAGEGSISGGRFGTFYVEKVPGP
jgi:hypothetical protein